ncbi:MAG: hypothetical protein KDK36_08980 [Leptospiraceae bacterium]|nr:hypothetical protein [Leptospiraceae bacterium]
MEEKNTDNQNKPATGSKKCFLDTIVFQVCPSNCRSMLNQNKRWLGNVNNICIAKSKMREFVFGSSTFTVAVSAFLQSQAEIIDEFCAESAETLDLVRYFLNICEPEEVKDIVEYLSEETLYKILASDYENYLNIRKMVGKNKVAQNYFGMKSSRFWKMVSQEKICNIIVYLIRNKSMYQLAAQFLMILSPDVISQFDKYTDLNEEDEKNLFLALEDNIYQIPLISPKIYEHMMNLFQDNIEIFFVLETMGELVKRRAEIENVTQSFLKYQNKTGQKLSIQWIYSELFGMEYELVVEVLNQLTETNYISPSEKFTLQALLKTGSLEALSDVKLEILNQ